MDRVDTPDAATATALEEAHLRGLRGDVRGALRVVDRILCELAGSEPVPDHVAALRTILTAIVDYDVPRLPDSGTGPASHAASLCVGSTESWCSGNLYEGLRLNRSAVQAARDASATMQLYSRTLLAKKLLDIHFPDQALSIVADISELIRRYGLQAMESVPRVLNSIVLLQCGEFDEAIGAAHDAVRAAERRAVTIGVKSALSVAAMAHAGRQDFATAATTLDTFRMVTDDSVPRDTLARAAAVEIAVAAARDGVGVAVEQIRSRWPDLGLDTGFAAEDVTRAAWLITVARRAGDIALAERGLRTIERLAAANPDVSAPADAADHARLAFEGRELVMSVVPVVGTGQPTGRRLTGHLHAVATEPSEQAPAGPASTTRAGLSSREAEIARLVVSGMTNQQAATRLGLSPHTVNFHLRNVFRKLDISTRAELGRILGSWAHAGPGA